MVFPHRAGEAALLDARRRIFSALKAGGLLTGARYISLESLDALERQFLAERHHMPHGAGRPAGCGMVVSRDEELSVSINILDHFRAQCIVSGFAVEEACAAAGKLEKSAGRALTYARSARFGYLSACPANSGTGLRVSCLAHAPALARLGRMPEIIGGFSGTGVTAKGVDGAGACVLGDFYQIASAAGPGAEEGRICAAVVSVVRGLVAGEAAAREKLFSRGEKKNTEDAVWRAYGALRYARILSYREFMQHLSLVRLGAAVGTLAGLSFGQLNRLTLSMQPAHLQAAAPRRLPLAELDELRALFVRAALD